MLTNTRSRSISLSISRLALLSAIGSSLTGCSDDSSSARGREEGQSEFQSAPPVGQAGSASFGAPTSAEAADKNAGSAGSSGAQSQIAKPATPEETDIYRVEGDRLYFLNAYRGLLVFDITNPDAPSLRSRSPVYGTPVEMFVENGIATMVLGDWYGNAADGSPFHGSIVRTVDVRDAANPKVLGDLPIKGWARDMRVVGSNLFIVSEDYGWTYGFGGLMADSVGVGVGVGGYGGSQNAKVVISSVRFGNRAPTLTGTKEFDGFSGAFNVTSSAIIMAHDNLADGPQGYKRPTGKASVDYIFFNALDGQIVPQGTFEVDGLLNGWSADNGRWNIDFTDNTVSVFTCSASEYGYCNGGSPQNAGYKLTTIDFTNPAAPQRLGAIDIASKGYAATARFSNKRMYLSPRDGVFSSDGSGQAQPTPLDVYDLSIPATPKLAGSTTVNGAVWLFMPVGADRLFALGNEYGNGYSSSKIALRWIDVADATQPKVIGTSTFGEGWAWTPAAGTFKAFMRDDGQKLVVLPFSGWSRESSAYMNGVQLIEYNTGEITTKGAARSKGWVERGVFAKNRLVSLSDQALSVIDYSDRNNPKVVNELTLARNVVSAEPNGATIAQLSTDWWGYDQQKSELRVLPIANAEENVSEPNAKSVSIDGTNARIFRDPSRDLAYVVTTVFPKDPAYGYQGAPHIQVVDLANGGAVTRGSLDLPLEENGYWSWWGGYSYWDWYDGSNAMLVGNDALAFRRTRGSWDPATSKYVFDQKLYVVDLSNADAPKLTSTTITSDTDSWWGNMRVVGDTLYTTHYEWLTKQVANPDPNGPRETYWVRYYLDQIDISDRANPKVGQRINVPGMLVGASENDPSLLYFIDYRWYSDYNTQKNDIAVARIRGGKAYLQSSTAIDGWVGNVFVRGTKAYASAQEYTQNGSTPYGTSKVTLHEIDLTNPKQPVDRPSTAKDGWGWLLDVEGDRAIVTSGWGQAGLDIYKLADGQAPVYSQFARTRGWWSSALSRQNDDLYLSTGYWGVQKITLK